MQQQQNIIDCYDKTAADYAKKFNNELEHKHFDRILLSAFAEENKNKGTMIDLGCGPGQTTGFLYSAGVKNIIGTDLSAAMVKIAKDNHPDIQFEVADMLQLAYSPNRYAAAIAFYAIVHFDYAAVETAFRSIHNNLQPNGQFLLSFHIGNKTVHMDEFLDQKVDIDFYFFQPDQIISLLEGAGFSIIDNLQRAPYEAVEYASQRAYIWAMKNN